MISDLPPGLSKGSAASSSLLFAGTMKLQGRIVTRIEMRQYIQRSDERLGPYSLLTVEVETDAGTVEMKYDEGFKGIDALESAARFVTQYGGISALVTRALLELERNLE